MILELTERVGHDAPLRIERAISAVDPQASVAVSPITSSVTIEGSLSKDQAIAALVAAGFSARPAHVSGGSDCCGGCT